MTRDYRLLFGPLAACVLAAGIVGVAIRVPGYSHVRQTVSEIGEMGSPGRIPFLIMLSSVAACLFIFAAGVRAFPHPLQVRFSWIMFALIWISIALNLSSLDRQGASWAELKPVYGLVQRSLFASWFCWCAGT